MPNTLILRDREVEEYSLGAVTRFCLTAGSYADYSEWSDGEEFTEPYYISDRVELPGQTLRSIRGTASTATSPFTYLIDRVTVRVVLSDYYNKIEEYNALLRRPSVPFIELITSEIDRIDNKADQLEETINLAFVENANRNPQLDGRSVSWQATPTRRATATFSLDCFKLAEFAFPVNELSGVIIPDAYRGTVWGSSLTDIRRYDGQSQATSRLRKNNFLDRESPVCRALRPWDASGYRSFVMYQCNPETSANRKRFVKPNQCVAIFGVAPLLYLSTEGTAVTATDNIFGLSIQLEGYYSRSLEDLIPYV